MFFLQIDNSTAEWHFFTKFGSYAADVWKLHHISTVQRFVTLGSDLPFFIFGYIRAYFISGFFSLWLAAIGNAFAVLSDPTKRQRYDQFGTEEEQAPVRCGQHNYSDGYYEYDFTRGFEGKLYFSLTPN